MTTFPGATASDTDASYQITGAPVDRTTTFRPGARFGPDRIRRFAQSFEDYDQHTGLQFSELGVHDRGDIAPFDDHETYLGYLEGVLAGVVRDDAVPITLGGEHSVTIAGLRAVDPDVVVSLDAHLDLREQFHGSPLNHACVMARALELADRVIIIGARSGSHEEWDRAADDAVTVVSPEEVSSWQPSFTDESVYLTVDIDVADPAVAPGTGTPEPFGLSSQAVRELVSTVAPVVDGADFVEVNDRDDGQAAVLGGKLLRRLVYDHAAAQTD